MNKKPKNYVDNKRLYAELVLYRKAKLQAKAEGTELPKIPEYVGLAFYNIALRITAMANFSGYSFREEMVSDAVLNCVKYIDTFDPNKTENAFSYFTRTIWRACLRRIDLEHTQSYVKHKSAEMMYFNDFKDVHDQKHFDKHDDKVASFIEKFESKRRMKNGSANDKDSKPSGGVGQGDQQRQDAV